MAARSSSAAPLRIAANASVTMPAPNRPQRSATRTAPMRVTAICACMSPRTSAGCRLLLRMMRSTSGSGWPASMILMGGIRMPSWKSSVAFADVVAVDVQDAANQMAIDRRVKEHRRRHDEAAGAVEDHAAEVARLANDGRVARAIEMVVHLVDEARD